MNSRFKREMGDPPTKDVPSAHQNSLAIGYPLTKFQSTNLLDLSISKHNIYQVRDLVNIHHLGASSIIYCKNTRICQTHQSAHPISLSEHCPLTQISPTYHTTNTLLHHFGHRGKRPYRMLLLAQGFTF